MGPASIILGLIEGLLWLALRIHYASDLRLESVPCLVCEWSVDVMISVVDEFVPKSMQLIYIVVVLKWEIVCASVAVGELGIIAILTVEGLD